MAALVRTSAFHSKQTCLACVIVASRPNGAAKETRVTVRPQAIFMGLADKQGGFNRIWINRNHQSALCQKLAFPTSACINLWRIELSA